MNVNRYKRLRCPVVWLFLLSVLGLAGSEASAQTTAPTDPNAASAQTPGSNTVNEIVSLLNKHDQALNQKDLNAVMSLYASGDTTVLMGTGPGEKWDCQSKKKVGCLRERFSTRGENYGER